MEKIKATNESFLGKLKYLSGTNTGKDGQAEEKAEDYFVLNDENVEEEELEELEVHTSGSSLPVAHTAVNHIKGLKISWGNCRGGKILLTAPNFLFPSMTFPKMLSMWFCGEISKNIPPYRMLRCKNVEQVKGGKQKLSNKKTLVKHVTRAALIANRNDLVVSCWSPMKVMDLYRSVRHFFDFPYLTYDKRRRYETMSWKTYFNILMKNKG